MFVMCPFPLSQWQQEIYRLAYEKAKADCEVPYHYKLFLNWN